MDTACSLPRVLTTLDENAPFQFRVWLYGDWGFETNARLNDVLDTTPRRSRGVSLDCRRVTRVDGKTMGTMKDFAQACAERGVGVTFECDDDPVGRMITLCHLDQLEVMRRPLRSRTAGIYRR